MAELAVANTYAEALFLAGKELQVLDELKDEMIEMLSLFKENPDFYELLNNPSLSTKEKKSIVDNVFKDNIRQEIKNFMFILIDKRRMYEFEKITNVYNHLVDKEEGFAVGTVYSAKELNDNQIARLEEETGKLLKERIKLNNEIDKSLIGGVRILVDGKVIDASIKTKLKGLREHLINN